MARRADEDPKISVRRAAMNLLARREQSFFELTQKLSEKFPDLNRNEVILPALEKLRNENLQSDARFAEAYVRYRQTRGMGPLKIGIEMGQKGVEDHLIQDALYNPEIDWLAHCHEVMEKKYPQGSADTHEERQKQYRFLQQRGFEGEHIRRVIGWN